MNEHIVAHFSSKDQILARIIPLIPAFTLHRSDTPYFSLVESIISQQLSVKAGDTIVKRFVSLFSDEKVTPEATLLLTRESLRNVGMSWNKVDYVQNVAKAVTEGTLDFKTIDSLDDESVIAELTKIKGIGRWTAEMFLMFTLGREDVFSSGDVGLQNAIQQIYSLPTRPTKVQMEQISEKWKPYRTYACKILWRSLELK